MFLLFLGSCFQYLVFICYLQHISIQTSHIPRGFPGDPEVKNPTANAESSREVGLIRGSGRLPWRRKWQPALVLAWKIPWTEESGRLQSVGSHRVWHNWVGTHMLYGLSNHGFGKCSCSVYQHMIQPHNGFHCGFSLFSCKLSYLESLGNLVDLVDSWGLSHSVLRFLYFCSFS